VIDEADRARVVGRLLMAGAVLQMLLFFAGLARRSYLVVALPVGAGLAVVSGLAFWVGYTMAYGQWDEDAETFEEAPADPAPTPPDDPAE